MPSEPAELASAAPHPMPLRGMPTTTRGDEVNDWIDAILDRLGRDHLQQIMARDSHPKGSSTWHRFDQGRWAFKEAALSVDRATGYKRDIYDAWVDEWSPERDD